jgi:hypothetical protein
MKKLVFTCFAMLAFNGISIANNHSDIKIKTFDQENIAVFFTSCENWAMDQMAINDPQDQMSPSEAHDEYRSLVEMCDSH